MRKFCLILTVAAIALLTACSAANRQQPQEFLNIGIGANCSIGAHWEYTVSKAGIVMEVPYEAVEVAEKVDENGLITIDMPYLPGNQHFFFVGVAEGVVDINFSEYHPGNDAVQDRCTYKVKVLPDLTLLILDKTWKRK